MWDLGPQGITYQWIAEFSSSLIEWAVRRMQKLSPQYANTPEISDNGWSHCGVNGGGSTSVGYVVLIFWQFDIVLARSTGSRGGRVQLLRLNYAQLH